MDAWLRKVATLVSLILLCAESQTTARITRFRGNEKTKDEKREKIHQSMISALRIQEEDG